MTYKLWLWELINTGTLNEVLTELARTDVDGRKERHAAILWLLSHWHVREDVVEVLETWPLMWKADLLDEKGNVTRKLGKFFSRKEAWDVVEQHKGGQWSLMGHRVVACAPLS